MGVETDVFEVRDAFGFAQIRAVAFAEEQDGAAGAKTFLPRNGGRGCEGSVGIDSTASSMGD